MLAYRRSTAAARVRPRRTTLLLAVIAAAAAGCGRSAPPSALPAMPDPDAPPAYYPEPGDDWARRTAEEAGMDAALLDSAVAFAEARETRWPVEVRAAMQRALEHTPHPEILGPVRERGAANGIIVRHGYIVAEWGDTRRVDMAFEITSGFLSAVAGVAVDLGLIRSVTDAVRPYVEDDGFDSPRNAGITWHQLLSQTSEWQGTLWGKPDSADLREGRGRMLRPPGTFWEHNAVRLNRTAYSLLQVWKKPLPDALKAEVMDPIGASDTWEWHGYPNSWVGVGDVAAQSVAGDGRWGGGLRISTRDLARFGYLHLRQGRWRDRQVLSREWVRRALTPAQVKPTYGYLWWLNTGHALYPNASPSSFFARGSGTSILWVDPELDLVVVARWIEPNAIDELIRRARAAAQPAEATSSADTTSPEIER